MLRSAVFAKYPGLPISKSYDQNKFSCFPLMKTARINEKGGLYKGEKLACSHVQIQDPKKKAAQCSLVVSRLGFFTPAISCFFAIFASFERFGFLHHEQLR